ncbi:POT family proton-dependent oligopeptide transporter [Streptosporangium becharense]|uniref:POT family proton-dependent oligopeptide transporter n=1 Tax=Streptosporangium becharense TaxID=1816182 RepID=A0A7W9MEW8_9ACTN|nr:oligopeptide:H+ symporter [Streptosporangium becharense]MBB2915270.1 POT family proton-dependent oligopeptide transporter [Streptosporangium becharense]MBB5817901.1 POT family proton-dependent oligopeptide transporter [Streptosporangium becharense]
MTSGAPARERTFFGHPRGLATLFGTEMWERFSWYGLRAILATFMAASPVTGGLGMSEQTAQAVIGVYGALIYLVALPGGWVADRVLGARRAVLWGGFVIMLGHISMAIPVTTPAFVWLGLFLIVIGTGLLKPNISAMVGKLYPEDDDARRDAGFSLFYLGINLGAFIAPIVVGWLARDGRWHLGFGAAAVGMALGLTQYVRGRRHLRGVGDRPGHRLTAAERRHFTIALVSAVVLVAVAMAVWVASGTFSLDGFALVMTLVIVAVPVLYFGYILLGAHGLTEEEHARMRAYVWLFAAAAVFWMIYDLAPTVLLFFAEHRTDLNLLGLRVTPATTQSFNPLFIMVFVPVFAALWVKLGERVTAPQKFAFALFMVGLSFVVMALAARLAASGRVSVWWLVLVYLVQVFGELALSPVGLSVTTKLAPEAFKGQMLGVWFIAVSVGDAVGGQTGRLREHMSEPAYFLTLAAIALAAGAALLASAGRLRVLMREHAAHPGG